MRKGKKIKGDGKEGKQDEAKKEKRTRKREITKISACTGASNAKSRGELLHKSLNAIAESHHDVEVVTWRWKGDGVNNLVSSQSAHMTTLHLFRVCYAVIADEGNGLQLRRLAGNILKEQNV